MSGRNPYKKRIRIIVDILGDVLGRKNIDREKLIDIVKEVYERNKLEPLRGKAFPQDIYDKELASLYVIAKYGLGLDSDYPDHFNKLFSKEIMFEEALENLLEKRYSETKEILLKISKTESIDSNTIARMLRIIFTKIILGFEDEDVLIDILKKVKEAFPSEERTVRNYVRFYIAFKTAEEIARGNIRNKVMKEAYKQALSVRLGFEKVVPSDEYIKEIASKVFRVPQHILDKILTAKEKEQ
ncbi:MAG: DUF2192 domain-containing protein [Desulfurococcales archaeon]|nr:DUF2192 domain-containing protein [Desulfurococcales archaeon]